MMASAAPRPLPVSPNATASSDVYYTLINLVSRQRMLSQRIVLFALLAHRGEANALPVAQEALLLFRASHVTLTKGREGIPAPFNDELRDVFFGAQGADAPITTFIRLAEETLADIARLASTVDRRLQTLVSQATPMLSVLNKVTQAYERQARLRAHAQRDAPVCERCA